MTRVMADTTHVHVHDLPIGTFQLVAGYDTGTWDIRWTPEDWALFPKLVHVHIDQGFGDSPIAEAHVLVFDVEQGAFSPDQAGTLINVNTSARPTIYVNRDNMYATIGSAKQSPKWKGDVWLAFPGWKAGEALPPLPAGCRYVAIQNLFAGNYDTSIVLDNSWPNPLDEPPGWQDQVILDLQTVSATMARVIALVKANTP